MLKLCSYTFLTVLIVDLLATSSDMLMTWTSPTLPKLRSNDSTINPLPRPVTPEEESWIGSLINLAALIGPLPGGLISTKFGRKVALLSIAAPYIISLLILATVHNVYWYYVARALAGISFGASYTILPLYIAEIAEDHNRGSLSVSLNVFWTFGTLIPYLIGPYLSMFWFNITLACVPVLFFVLFLLLAPESPYFLIRQNKIQKAEETLVKLRSRRRSFVKKEILQIQSMLNQDSDKKQILDLLKTKANRKALFISLGLISFQQLSGIGSVLVYTQLIFQEAGSDLPSEISSIIVGLVFFLSSFISPCFADSVGRKILLLISSTGTCLSLISFGTYFYFKDNLLANMGKFQWVPILSLVVYNICFTVGFSSIPWTVSSELFSINEKQVGNAVVAFTARLWSFIVTKFFYNLTVSIGKSGTFWLFGGFCFIANVFTLIFVPETKGKSFSEIRKILEK